MKNAFYKKVLFLILSVGVFFLNYNLVFADQTIQSNTWKTCIGDDTFCANQTLITNPTLVNISSWAEKIDNSLGFGYHWSFDFPFFNKMITDINSGSYSAVIRSAINAGVSETGLYWCTDMVIDSYGLAGKTELSNPRIENVEDMINAWKNLSGSGYNYISCPNNDCRNNPSQTVFSQVQPGAAIFFTCGASAFDRASDCYGYAVDQGSHTGIVASNNLDQHGNGTIITYESNSTNQFDNQKPIYVQHIHNWQYIGPYKFNIGGFGTVN